MAERFIPVRLTLTTDDRQFKQAFSSLKKEGENAALSLRERFSKISDGLQTIGTRLTAGITAPLALLGTGAVRAARDMDSLNRGMIAVSGSAAKAKQEIGNLREVAKLPGLGFKEAIQGSINLQAAGLSADLARRSLGAFGNALATVGKGKAELDGVNTALSQIVSKGKVSAEEINQIAERVPQIRKVMQAAFGTADTEKLQKANVSSLDFITKIVGELEKLPKVTGGAQNSFENLADTAEQALVPVGNAILRFVIPAIERATPIIETLSDSFARLTPEAQNFAIGAAGIAAAIGPVTFALGTFISSATTIAGLFAAEGALTLGVSGFGTAVAATFAAAGPVGIAIVGATALAGALYLLSQGTEEVKSATLGEIQSRAQQAQTAQEAIAEIKNLGGAVFVTKEEQLKLKSAYESLTPVAQERLRQITKESELTNVLAAELEKLKGQSKIELEFEGSKAVAEFANLNSQIKLATEIIAENEAAFKRAFAANDTRALEGLSATLKINREDFAALSKQIEETKAKIQAVTQATGANTRDLAINAQVKGLIKDYQSVATALETAIPAAKTAATNLGTGATGALKDAVRVSEIFRVGTDVGSGLAAGINSEESRAKVRAAAANLGKVAEQATSSQLERKSPSRVFMRIGGDITEGLILGIKSKASDLKKTLKELLKEATETAKEIAGLSNPQIFAAKLRNADLSDRRQQADDVFGLLRESRSFENVPKIPLPKALPKTAAGIAALGNQLENLKQLDATISRIQKGEIPFYLELPPSIVEAPPAIRAITEAFAEQDKEVSKALQSYDQIKSGLQGVIDSAEKLTASQKLLKQIGTLPGDFDPLKRKELEGLATQARGIELRGEEEKRQLEQVQRAQQTAQKIGDFFTQAFRDSFERGPRAFFDRLASTAKETLARIGAEITKNLVMRLLNLNGGISGSSAGSGSGGGGVSIPGIGPGGTATFSGSPISFGGNLGGGMLGKIPGIGNFFSGKYGLGKIGSLLGFAPSAAAKTAFVEGALTSAFGPATAAAAGAGGTGAFAGATASAGAAGGGGLMASIGALASNPITIAAAAAIGGGFLLWKLFSGRDLKKLRSTIQGEYSVDVKDKNVLKQIKEIGQGAFGKSWKDKMAQTVRLEPSKELISTYAQQTGQQSSKLATAAQLGDPFFAGNRFERREFGGPVLAGVPYLVGERRPEVFVPDRSGQIVPSVEQYRQGNGRSGGGSDPQSAALLGAITQLIAMLARFQAVTPGQVLQAGAQERGDVIGQSVLAYQRQNPNFTRQFTQTQHAGQL